MATFNLEEYYDIMRDSMRENGFTAANTVKRFTTNLAALRPIYKGFDDVPFNILGQQWNKLGYRERNDQFDAAVFAVDTPRFRGRRETIDE